MHQVAGVPNNGRRLGTRMEEEAMRRALLRMLAVVAAMVACLLVVTAGATQAQQPCVAGDDFEGAALDTSRWNAIWKLWPGAHSCSVSAGML